jgi:hypothetical protein
MQDLLAAQTPIWFPDDHKESEEEALFLLHKYRDRCDKNKNPEDIFFMNKSTPCYGDF